MFKAKAYSAASATSPLSSAIINRRDPTDHDVQIEVLFCGICHSDLHQARNEWSGFLPTVYPCVPGHEIVGRVTASGFCSNLPSPRVLHPLQENAKQPKYLFPQGLRDFSRQTSESKALTRKDLDTKALRSRLTVHS